VPALDPPMALVHGLGGAQGRGQLWERRQESRDALPLNDPAYTLRNIDRSPPSSVALWH
jgi:hypothetical protein